MKRTEVALLAVTAIATWLSLIPAHAAPPTVTPSPGYDARLQEQRAGTSAGSSFQQQVTPVVKPAPPRRSRKPPAH